MTTPNSYSVLMRLPDGNLGANGYLETAHGLFKIIAWGKGDVSIQWPFDVLSHAVESPLLAPGERWECRLCHYPMPGVEWRYDLEVVRGAGLDCAAIEGWARGEIAVTVHITES